MSESSKKSVVMLLIDSLMDEPLKEAVKTDRLLDCNIYWKRALCA
ncbi:hypothetical protein PO124_19630 [Bacillus licheniformis]|nr:hypothetical protein [Bacillus licheniformis]